MTTTPEPEFADLEQPKDLRQWGLSWIRTTVPVAWGLLLTYLATRFPSVHALLGDPHVYAVVEGAVTLVWYGIFRAIEGYLPAWLTRFVLGANTAPIYPARGMLVDGDGFTVR